MDLTKFAVEVRKWDESNCQDMHNPRVEQIFRHARIDFQMESEESKSSGLESASNENKRRSENSAKDVAARSCRPCDSKIDESNLDDILRQHVSMGCANVAPGLPVTDESTPASCNRSVVCPADRTEDLLSKQGSAMSWFNHLNVSGQNGLQIYSKSGSSEIVDSNNNFDWLSSCPGSRTLLEPKDSMEMLRGIEFSKEDSNGGYMKIWNQARADAKNRKGRERSLRTRMRNAERLRALEIGCSLLSEENARIKEIIRELVFYLPMRDAVEIDCQILNSFTRSAGICIQDGVQDGLSYLNDCCSSKSNTTF
jgi:hypothetical protein